MTELYEITKKLKDQFPSYTFFICRGVFGKYISVEIHGQIAFTIWIDKNTGHKVLLDEINFNKHNWLKKILKSKSFHWSKFRNLPWRRDYHNIIAEKIKLANPERKLVRNRLELSLQEMHLIK